MARFATSAIGDFVSGYDLDGAIECVDDSIPGDINGDGVVDGTDLSILLGYWGLDAPDVDINGDGVIDGTDLSIVLGHWTV